MPVTLITKILSQQGLQASSACTLSLLCLFHGRLASSTAPSSRPVRSCPGAAAADRACWPHWLEAAGVSIQQGHPPTRLLCLLQVLRLLLRLLLSCCAAGWHIARLGRSRQCRWHGRWRRCLARLGQRCCCRVWVWLLLEQHGRPLHARVLPLLLREVVLQAGEMLLLPWPAWALRIVERRGCWRAMLSWLLVH